MKLLLDQNLSFRIISMLSKTFESVSHISQIGLINATDKKIWDYAREHNFVIVSKDSDFHQLSFLLGAPPKVIWIRKGNCSTLAIAQLLINNELEIEKFVSDNNSAFLILD